MCLHVQPCKLLHVWHTLSHVCIVYKWLCFCVPHCAVLHTVQDSIFISSSGCPEAKAETESNPARNQNLCHQCQAWVKSQLALHLLLQRTLSSTISHLLPLLQAVTLLACSLDPSPSMPAVVLYNCTLFKVLYGKIKNIYFLCLFSYVLFVLCIITVVQ